MCVGGRGAVYTNNDRSIFSWAQTHAEQPRSFNHSGIPSSSCEGAANGCPGSTFTRPRANSVELIIAGAAHITSSSSRRQTEQSPVPVPFRPFLPPSPLPGRCGVHTSCLSERLLSQEFSCGIHPHHTRPGLAGHPPTHTHTLHPPDSSSVPLGCKVRG